MDEVLAILYCVPFFGFAVAWVRNRQAMWKRRHEKPCCVHTHGHEERL